MHEGKINQTEFQNLVKAKWTISLCLAAVMLAIYFGFILVLAFNKQILAHKLGEFMNVGLPVGLGVILSACVLTGIYVAWANSSYDKTVKNIIDHMKR